MTAWIAVDDVKAALGIAPADTTDDDWLERVTGAANDVASRRRSTAGYDDTDAVPAEHADVVTGTVLYALSLYRERGSFDGAGASFAELGAFVPTGGSWGQINRLWGTNRPGVDWRANTPAVLRARRWRP